MSRQRVAAGEVAALRRFNRFYTHRLGLLNAHLDQSPFTLTEARVLYELANRSDPTAAEIMRALDLDRAQLSRTLQRFEERGLLTRRVSDTHGRHQLLSLTRAGRAAFTKLEGHTVEAISSLLGRLTTVNRGRLLAAVDVVREVLEADAPASPAFVLRAPVPGDLGWIIHRQAILYAEEYGWNQDYEALVARILAGFVEHFDPSLEAAWVAESAGAVVGSIFLVRGDEPTVGKLRLLYVERVARGLGIGGALIDACIERARQVGYERLQLWTNSVLESARRLYERAGFVLVEQTAHHSFGKDLVGQTWSLDLRATAGGLRSTT